MLCATSVREEQAALRQTQEYTRLLPHQHEQVNAARSFGRMHRQAAASAEAEAVVPSTSLYPNTLLRMRECRAAARQ